MTIELLELMFEKASKAGVCCSLNFNAGGETYDVIIQSAAPTENYMTKDYGDPEMVVELALAHLDTLLKLGAK